MKIETQAQEDHQVKVTAEIETSALEKYKHQAARKIAQKAKIPGFRPGKAPYDVILRLYGEPSIKDEAIGLLVDEVYPQILDEAKIEPGAPGSLQDISQDDPIKLTFLIPLEPTVDLAGYKDVRKKYALKEVSKKEIDDFIQHLKRNYATAEPVERPAEKGDLVYVKLDANVLKPAEGDKAELLKDSPLQVAIGESDPNGADFPYSGFGENLIKLSAGDEKTVKYTYPADSQYEKLQNKEVEFHVKVESVKSLILPEFDDAFAQTVGEFENAEKLKESIKDQLEARNREEYEGKWFEELVDEIVKQSVIKYPPQVLEHEMEHVVESVQEDLARQKLELDMYLKTIKKEKAAWLNDEIKPTAAKRLERELVLEELAKAEGIQVKNEDLQAEVGSMIQEMQMQGALDIKKFEKQLKDQRVANNMAMQAAARVFNRRVLDRLKEIATGKAEAAPAVEGETAVKTKATSKKKTEAVAEPEKAKKPAKKAAEPKQE